MFLVHFYKKCSCKANLATKNYKKSVCISSDARLEYTLSDRLSKQAQKRVTHFSLIQSSAGLRPPQASAKNGLNSCVP